ncbi:hypothetical protein [Aeoliella sp. SH292]|uniref:hypothetical protein n=1 Tax=Aeoliella sp. SH292 TaxID=3454464 RepID=UPI003F9C8941
MRLAHAVMIATLGALLLSTSGFAGTISFSGRDWTTVDNGVSTYTAVDANTGRIVGTTNDGLDSGMSTLFSASVGDTLEFLLDIDTGSLGSFWDVSVQFGSNDSTGSCCGGSLAADRILYRSAPNQLYFQSFVNNVQYSNINTTTPTDGVKFSFTFDTETTAELTISNQISPGVYAVAAVQTVNLTNIADIDTFRIGSYANSQPVTISEFGIVPEPSSLVLAGLVFVIAGTLRGSRRFLSAKQ